MELDRLLGACVTKIVALQIDNNPKLRINSKNSRINGHHIWVNLTEHVVYIIVDFTPDHINMAHCNNNIPRVSMNTVSVGSSPWAASYCWSSIEEIHIGTLQLWYWAKFTIKPSENTLKESTPVQEDNPSDKMLLQCSLDVKSTSNKTTPANRGVERGPHIALINHSLKEDDVSAQQDELLWSNLGVQWPAVLILDCSSGCCQDCVKQIKSETIYIPVNSIY